MVTRTNMIQLKAVSRLRLCFGLNTSSENTFYKYEINSSPFINVAAEEIMLMSFSLKELVGFSEVVKYKGLLLPNFTKTWF